MQLDVGNEPYLSQQFADMILSESVVSRNWLSAKYTEAA